MYLGIAPINGLIKNSSAEAVALNAPDQFEGIDIDALEPTTLDPDDIAEVFWDLNAERDRVEEVVGDWA